MDFITGLLKLIVYILVIAVAVPFLLYCLWLGFYFLPSLFTNLHLDYDKISAIGSFPLRALIVLLIVLLFVFFRKTYMFICKISK